MRALGERRDAPHYAHAPNEWISVEEFITTAKM
jgi:hypothetical protein